VIECALVSGLHHYDERRAAWPASRAARSRIRRPSSSRLRDRARRRAGDVRRATATCARWLSR